MVVTLRRLGTPALLAAIGLALWVWVSIQELDSIERRLLDGGVLLAHVNEHLALAASSTAIVVVVAVSLGIVLTRPALGRVTPIAIGVANIGQATPSIGLLVLIALVGGIGFAYAVIALVAYSTLPVLRNTIVASSRWIGR